MLVSKHLRIGYCEMLHLRERLGEALTHKLIRAHGLMSHPNQVMSPLEPSWKCPGRLAYGKINARECTFRNRDDGNANTKYEPTMAGGEDSSRAFFGYYICAGCRRGMDCLEYAAYSDSDSGSALTEDQQKRFEKIEGYRANHRERENNRRTKKIEDEGIETVQQKELIRNRTSQNRLALKMIHNENFRNKQSAKRKAQ